MRIENQPSQGVTDSNRTSATRSAGQEASTGHVALPKIGTDQVSLSGASSLLSLAKSLPSHKQSKVTALTSQYSAGQYRPDSATTSRSLVSSLGK